MTENKGIKQNFKTENPQSFLKINKNSVIEIFILFFLLLTVRNSSKSAKYMLDGLNLCVKTVIPALFPFMVVSELAVSSGALNFLVRLLDKPAKYLLGVSGNGGCATVLGAICGFPIGTRSTLTMYKNKKITKSEFERILTFANNPSVAFCINAVGISMFENKKTGVVLYISTLISALIVGIFENVCAKCKTDKSQMSINHKNAIGRKEERKIPCEFDEDKQINNINRINRNVKINVNDFTKSITDSAVAMLKICGFVVFFTALLGTITEALTNFDLPQTVKSLIFGFFEITNGMSGAAKIENKSIAPVIAGFVSGWSGLSVHLQIMSFCTNENVSFKPYFAAKFAQGIINAALMYFLKNLL